MEDSWIDPSDDVHSIWWLHAPFTGLSGSSGVSLLWISNVNYFGSVGGFDMLLHRISFGCNGDDGLSEDSSKISIHLVGRNHVVLQPGVQVLLQPKRHAFWYCACWWQQF